MEWLCNILDIAERKKNHEMKIRFEEIIQDEPIEIQRWKIQEYMI